jgi:glyoxylase-like metal-dependent hydrolase (beta-lactamase superfamily II)
MKRVLALGVLVVVGGWSMAVAGFQGAPAGQGRGGRGPQAAPVAQIQSIRDNLYLITGGGGNTAAYVTDAGVVLVDTKLANWGQAILDQVRTVTDKPVTMIINTHTHGDHTGSNNFFGATVDIVAHANTKTNMERMDAFRGEGATFLPKQTFTDKTTVGSGASQIDLYHFGPGHTNGDAFVVFREPRVMHAGDMFPGKSTPFVDTSNGGSVVKFGETLTQAAAVPNVDTVIPGHSTVMAAADLREYAAFMTDIGAWVAAQMQAGKTVDQAAAEFQVPAKYTGYTVGNMGGGIRGIIQTAYAELGR